MLKSVAMVKCMWHCWTLKLMNKTSWQSIMTKQDHHDTSSPFVVTYTSYVLTSLMGVLMVACFCLEFIHKEMRLSSRWLTFAESFTDYSLPSLHTPGIMSWQACHVSAYFIIICTHTHILCGNIVTDQAAMFTAWKVCRHFMLPSSLSLHYALLSWSKTSHFFNSFVSRAVRV